MFTQKLNKVLQYIKSNTTINSMIFLENLDSDNEAPTRLMQLDTNNEKEIENFINTIC